MMAAQFIQFLFHPKFEWLLLGGLVSFLFFLLAVMLVSVTGIMLWKGTKGQNIKPLKQLLLFGTNLLLIAVFLLFLTGAFMAWQENQYSLQVQSWRMPWH